jgi:uncharacterized protein YecT (DUF1311 family)
MRRHFLIFVTAVWPVLATDPAVVVAEELVSGWSNLYAEPKAGKNCDANEGTLAECEKKKMEHSSKYLAALNGKIAKALPADSAKLFQRASALWLQFRDASCQYDAAGAAGNSRDFRYAACAHSYNKSRIELLSKYAYCLDGGECAEDLQLYYLVWPPGN